MNALSLAPERFELSEFSEEEEHTGIHVVPTLSMPPVPADDPATLAISNTIAALLAESDAEEKLEDLTESAEASDHEAEQSAVAQASLPPAPETSFAPPAPSPSRQGRRLGRMAFAIAAAGFAVGFIFTRPAEVPAPAIEAAEVVSVPTVSIAAAATATATATAPAESATPVENAGALAAPAAKAPPTLVDANWMLNQNNLARAEQIYQSILANGGSDHEALTGLGKVALRRGQDNDAIAFFERALARQPQYFPARLGIADALWNSGKKDSAKARYAALREGYADNMIPSRVVERTR